MLTNFVPRRPLRLCTAMEISSALTALSMTRPKDIRDAYRRYAEACLAVLGKTANPTSQAMLAAMAHTWLRLADSGLVADRMDAEPYRRNADDALRWASNAEPQVRALWLRLAELLAPAVEQRREALPISSFKDGAAIRTA